MTLYGRQAELKVDDRQFTDGDFTVYFEIPFDDDSTANVATVKIYNLSDQTISRFKSGSSAVIINAGYTGDVGAVLLGYAKEIQTAWQDVDRVTTINVIDGTESWYTLTYKNTFNKGVSAKTILTAMLAQTGLQIGSFNLPTNRIYRSGKTVSGRLSEVIKAIAKDCGAKAHVTRGKIFIRPKDEGDNIGFDIDADSGLIESPTPIDKEVDGGKDKNGKPTKVKKRGWNVTTLLNHRITTDALIKITSRTANGVFRVESGKHISNGADFLTQMEVYPV
jgi:hypothetical protein